MTPSDEATRLLLRDAVRSVEEDYRVRGIFQDRFGFGRSPALVVVDFAYGWTDDAYAGGAGDWTGRSRPPAACSTRRATGRSRSSTRPAPGGRAAATRPSSPRPTRRRGSG